MICFNATLKTPCVVLFGNSSVISRRSEEEALHLRSLLLETTMMSPLSRERGERKQRGGVQQCTEDNCGDMT